MPKIIFDDQVDWDSHVENVGLKADNSGISLDSGATPLQLADDFDDGTLDPLWIQGHPQNSLIAAFDPFGLSPPASEEPLGVTNLRTSLAQSFTLPIAIEMSELQLHLELFPPSSPFTPDIIIEIQTDNAGEPSGTALASKTIPFASLLPGSLNGWTVFDFSDTLPSLPANQKLWIVLTTNPVGTSGDNITWQYDLNHDLANEALKFKNGSTGQWQSQFDPTRDFYFRLSRQVNLNTKPNESGGFLSFEYNNTGGTGEHIHALRNFAQGDWELETRFQLRRLAPNFNSGQFIIGILQGDKSMSDDATREAKLLHQLRFNTQDNFNVSFTAEMVDTNGTVHTSGSASWPNINNQGSFLANDPHIFNLKVTRVGNGLKYLFYHSDNPANVLLETDVSPDVIVRPGDIHLDLGANSLFGTSFGVAFDFDFFNLNTPPQQFPTGFRRYHHSFGVKTKLQNFEFQRGLPAPGDKVEIQFRSGSTIQGLESAAFGPVIQTDPGSFDPGNPQSEYEKAVLSIPEAEFFETRINLSGDIPGPLCQKYVLEFSEVAPPVVIEENVKPLSYRRIIDSDSNWNQFVDKSSSIQITGGKATLSPVFSDQFDGFEIGPEWTRYQKNANLFESFDFLRMNILAQDADAALVKTDPIPTTVNISVRWKPEGLDQIFPSGFFIYDIFSIYNKASIPIPNDLRVGGLGTSDTHFTVIIRRSRFGDGVDRIGIVALQTDGTFVGWDENLGAWGAGVQDQVIPPGKENSEWTFDISINNGSLIVIGKDNDGTVQFDTTSQPLSIKINDNNPYIVLGGSDLSDMPVSTQTYDFVDTDIQTTGASSGFIRFRETLPALSRLGKIKLIPSTLIQSDPAPVSVKVRSANSLEDLSNQTFLDSGQFIPNVNGNELEFSNLAPGLFIEFELSLFSQSPGPEIIFLSWEIEPFIEDNAIILSPNQITKDALTISSSNGTGQTEDQTTVPNIKDGDPNTQWESNTGQEGFGISWALTIAFQHGSTPFEKVIDSIILRNTNFKKITITLSEQNSNNQETVFSGEILSENVLIRFPPKLTAGMILAIESSQFPNETKKLGEIYAGLLLVSLPCFDEYQPRQELVESGNFRTLGGKLINYRGRNKYASRWSVSQVPTEIKDQILKTYKENGLVTFWPEPSLRPDEIFDVGWQVMEIPFLIQTFSKTSVIQSKRKCWRYKWRTIRKISGMILPSIWRRIKKSTSSKRTFASFIKETKAIKKRLIG